MDLKEFDMKETYLSWRENSDPFEPFIRSGPFVSLQTYPNFSIEKVPSIDILDSKYIAITNHIIKYSKSNSYIIVDLPMEKTLDIAYLLNNKYSIKPILNFNFLFNEFGIIGNKESISKLLSYGNLLHSITPNNYVMSLDYDRYIKDSTFVDKSKLNNQYEVNVEYLPTPDYINFLKLDKVVLITNSPTKDDILDYLNLFESKLVIEV